jgi:gluconate 2-dehydrogenase gamma chain
MMDRRTLLQALALAATGVLHAKPAASKLDESQQKLVVELAELIIPRTETPGAIDAGVPAFIDHIVSDWYTPVERAIFVEGLKVIAAAGPSQRVAALQSLERQAASYVPSSGTSVFGKPDERSPFFFKLKLLTVLGYYTSALGATSELAFNPVPNRYDGNVDFATVGKQWIS